MIITNFDLLKENNVDKIDEEPMWWPWINTNQKGKVCHTLV